MLAHIYIFVFFCLEITTYRFAQRAENSEPGKSDKYIVYLARQREVVFKCHSGSQGLSQVGLCWCSQRRLQENHHLVTRTKKEKVAHALTKTLEHLPAWLFRSFQKHWLNTEDVLSGKQLLRWQKLQFCKHFCKRPLEADFKTERL